MCVSFQFTAEGLYLYQTVYTIRKELFKNKAFNIRDWGVRFAEVSNDRKSLVVLLDASL